MRTIVCAIAPAVLLGTVEFAAAEPFNGPYAGVEVGYESYGDDLDGAVYGGFAGWDARLGRDWVVGLEGRYAFPGASNRVRTVDASFETVGNTEIDSQWGFAARAGRLLAPSVLAYVQAGYERFEVDAVVHRTPEPGCALPEACVSSREDFSFDDDLWTVGGGVEWALTDNIRARGGYVYGNGDAFERHRVLVGVSYAF